MIRRLAALIFFLASSSCASRTKQPVIFSSHRLAIMQSVTSEEQTRFVVLVPAGQRFTYLIHDPTGSRAVNAVSATPENSPYQVDRIEIQGLSLGTSYELIVTDSQTRVWDRRSFKTLDTHKKDARFILTSCMDDHLTDVQGQMWRDVASLAPDAILMIGDTVYVDWDNGKRAPVSDAEQIWRRYGETRERLDIFKTNPLIPVFAVWDDHDYGKNDADRGFAFKEQAKAVFLAFFDQEKEAPGFERGPGVSSWLRIFGVQIALLYNRTFRTPNGADVPDQTHFGPDQELWIKQHLSQAQVPVLLTSGDQFFGGYHHFESYEGQHGRSFQAQLKEWRRISASPIVFMSGDRHLTEIIKVPPNFLGYPTYEITSSAIHAIVFPDAFKKDPSPRQLAGGAGQYNYSLIEILKSASKRVKLDVKAFGMNKRVLYQNTLTVKRQ